MSDSYLMHFVSHELHIIALTFMSVVYSVKIYHICRTAMIREKAPKKGSSISGILVTYAAIFMPWARESSRKHYWRWVEFGIYHVGAGIAIASTFTLAFFPSLLNYPLRVAFSILITLAILVGLVKIFRRIFLPEIRVISTVDDYFSLAVLEFFFLAAVMTLMTEASAWRITFFIITAGLLFYVPFSKISHYVYFLLSGIITGGRYGSRGVIPQTGRKD